VKVHWVACRGGIHDWAIYHSLDANIVREDYMDSVEHLSAPEWLIAKVGAKLHNMEKVKEFVNCSKGAMQMYRH
jgi:hypothetical protein